MSSRPPSRVVFVGNIPYGLSEEQITDIFSRAGKVINFRLVYDRETGKPKGFGFAEYPDADSAASAVRNLNDTEIMGRKLRVDFSNEGPGGGDKDDGPSNFDGGGGGGNSNGANPNSNNNGGGNPGLPPLPPGKDLPAGVSATDAISRTLRTLPPAQLLDILGQMKTMATTDPARATELLAQAPQLSYAIFQALLLMDLVSPDAIHSVVEPGAPIPAPPQQQQQQPPPAGYGALAPVFPPANSSGNTNTPPVVAPYAPPIVPIQQQAPPPPVAAAPADTDALMQQVLALPQATIDQLPEAERAQIMQLRASLLGQAR